MCIGIRNHSFCNIFDRTFKNYCKTRNNRNAASVKKISFERMSNDRYLRWITLIKESTIISRNHLTPEIQLHLITPDCSLWTADGKKSPFANPFWAFYWAGGQALSRYILDNPFIVAKKTVLDIGCGSGACSIAALMSNAKYVVANDTDECACAATFLNTQVNCVKVNIIQSNLIGTDIPWDCILVGDMFYDEEFGLTLFTWLNRMHEKGKIVLIGDAGRLEQMKIKGSERLTLLSTNHLSKYFHAENDIVSAVQVWSFESELN